jgi:hypothetical protein
MASIIVARLSCVTGRSGRGGNAGVRTQAFVAAVKTVAIPGRGFNFDSGFPYNPKVSRDTLFPRVLRDALFLPRIRTKGLDGN